MYQVLVAVASLAAEHELQGTRALVAAAQRFIRFSFWALGCWLKTSGAWLSCSEAYGIFPNQGSNQVDSLPWATREVQVYILLYSWASVSTGSTSLDSNNLILKNVCVYMLCVCILIPESFKKQNLNLPCSGNCLHSIYIRYYKSSKNDKV